MKIKNIILALFSFFILVLIVESCENNERINLNNNTTSRIQLKLVDSPDDNYLEVWVEIIDVQYNRNDDDSGWLSFDGYPKNTGDMVDLTSLIAGSSHILTDQEIESGMLSKVRLVLGDSNYLVIEGDEEGAEIQVDLKTPSAQQSGLKLHLDTEIVAGYSYDFTLDWDVQKSIVKAGNSGNYNLKPVIHVIAEANSGSIVGRIADSDETQDGAELMPLEDATIFIYSGSYDTEPIASTLSNIEGDFMMQGVPGGTYLLRIEKTDYDDVEFGEVIVTNGETLDVGSIHMAKSTGGIMGVVANSVDALPLENAVVTAYFIEGDDSETPVEETNTDVNGEFWFTDLLPGNYVFKVNLEGYDENQSDVITVIINETADAGTILLTITSG